MLTISCLRIWALMSIFLVKTDTTKLVFTDLSVVLYLLSYSILLWIQSVLSTRH